MDNQDDIKELNEKVNSLATEQAVHNERSIAMEKKLDKIENQIEELVLSLPKNKEEIISQVSNNFTTLIEFTPVKLIVFGMVGTILLTVFGAILGMVVLPQIKTDSATSHIERTAP